MNMRASKVLPLLVFSLLVYATFYASRPLLALSLEGGTQVVDNARVTVWDVIWPADVHGHIQRMTTDTVTVALTDGPIRIIDLAGAEQTVTRKIGDVRYALKGDGHREESAGAALPHDIVIELKDARVPPLANTSKYPNAFPRSGSQKVLENDRIIVWDYTWTPGVPTPMHFHDKDVVVTYLETGELASTSADGQVVNNPHYFGFAKWNTRDRAHTETLVKGKGRAVIVELK
jgi:hypothetical protein